MKKEIINTEEVEVMETEQEVVETETKENLWTKGKNWVKRNGKKIGVGALAIGMGIGGYVVGQLKKTADEAEDCCEDCDENEYDDPEFEAVDSEEENYGG